jgi:hypothetical protein
MDSSREYPGRSRAGGCRNPDDLPAFCEQLVKAFVEQALPA